MQKKQVVKNAVNHQSSNVVPYSIRLTEEAYKRYGQQLMQDFPNKTVQEDLQAGDITFNQAVDLSIGNYMVDVNFPWWSWDYDHMPEVYKDPFEEPDQMPPVIRQDTEERFAKFNGEAKFLSEKYGVYTGAMIWGSHWEKAYFTRGIENYLADIAAYPDFAQNLLNYIISLNMEILPSLAACEHLDGILLGSDWGTQNDLIMSPDAWRTMIKPGEKKQYEVIKKAGKHVMVHSCGCILRVMPDIVELGVDILNPVQPECMDLRFLKETYGDNISFWGGISTQKTLPYGTPEEVRKETADTVALMSQNGGYITCSSQEIQTDVPYENLKALIETAKSYT